MRWKVVMALMVFSVPAIWGMREAVGYTGPDDEPGWNGKAKMSGSEGFWLGCRWISSPKDIPVPEEVKEGWEKLLHSARIENEEKRQNILAQWRLQWQKEEFRQLTKKILERKVVAPRFPVNENSRDDIVCDGSGNQTGPCGFGEGMPARCGLPDRPEPDATSCFGTSCGGIACCPKLEIQDYYYVYDPEESYQSHTSNCYCQGCTGGQGLHCGVASRYYIKATNYRRKICSCGILGERQIQVPKVYMGEFACAKCCNDPSYGCGIGDTCDGAEFCGECITDPNKTVPITLTDFARCIAVVYCEE